MFMFLVKMRPHRKSTLCTGSGEEGDILLSAVEGEDPHLFGDRRKTTGGGQCCNRSHCFIALDLQQVFDELK